MLKLAELSLKNQRVLIREDFNVPLEHGVITDDQRLRAALPTIEQALKAGALVSIMTHLGRPKPGQFDPTLSLAPVATRLSELLGVPVNLVRHWQTHTHTTPGQVDLWENIRFCTGELENDADLAKQMAAHCDIFVMDAFATAHRQHASTHGVIQYAPVACAGDLLAKEVTQIQSVLAHPAKPVVAIVGGKKVSTKLNLLEALLDQVDTLIVGGGIANTFLAAAGYEIGTSLYEADLLPKAKALLALAQAKGVKIPLPVDVVVATGSDFHSTSSEKLIDAVLPTDCILDIGSTTAGQFSQIITESQTILWNGPVGLFEMPAYANGTKIIAQAIARSPALSVAGGGDTLAAIAQFGVKQDISMISTGGGAFLSLIEGKTLPAIAALEEKHAIKTD